MPAAFKILVLGGTQEARELCGQLSQDDRFDVILSLAGRTRAPLLPPNIEARLGGFGGQDGLARYIQKHAIALLVDATHPFADVISQSAFAASRATGIPCIQLARPEWEPDAFGGWQSFTSLEQIAKAIPRQSRCFLAIGRQQIGVFQSRPDCHFVIRSIEPPEIGALPADGTYIESWPGKDVDSEIAFLAAHDLSIMICKNSGGVRSSFKLSAAQALCIPIWMVERPLSPHVNVTTSVSSAMELILNSRIKSS